MEQFNFTANIEKRMPGTGEVYGIDRMTSDYAQAHPFDVDAFIENVYQEFAGTEFEGSREVLRSVWTATLSGKSPCGDSSIYPNNGGTRRPAAMKVWLKAGDYWRRGLRLGDTLPEMVPMTRITRLDDGAWIALFPKGAYLIENGKLKIENEEVNCEQPIIIEPSQHQSEPQQLDLFAFQQLQQENERLRLQLSQAQSQPRPCLQRKPRKPAVERQPSDISHQTSDTMKAIGSVVAMSVALVVIWQTGLLIPLGLIGLAVGGILK